MQGWPELMAASALALTPAPVIAPTGWAASMAALYDTPPDVATCRSGTMKASAVAGVVATVNEIRALHRLPPVAYATADEPQTVAAALMMAANGHLDHAPPASWKCYASAGATGAASSNLSGGVISSTLVSATNAEHIASWMTETTNLIADNVGHRRWLLDPFMSTIAFGRVGQQYADGSRTDGVAMKMFDSAVAFAPPTTLPPFVAYPFGDYPAKYFEAGALLSFGAIYNANDRFDNAEVDYARTTVSVRTRGGAALGVSNLSYDTLGYGLPNNLQWKVTGLVAGQYYDVHIDNVITGGTVRSYSYSFRII